MARRWMAAGPVVLWLVVLAGCSGYEKKWDAFAQEHGEGIGVVGRWRGTWKSETNGHAGDLRCIITQQDGGEFLAEYHATYMGALSSSYQSTFRPRYIGGRFQFEGVQDLGFLAGGVYRYDAEVDGDRFHATYQSKSDHGYYNMQRVRRQRQVQP